MDKTNSEIYDFILEDLWAKIFPAVVVYRLKFLLIKY